MIGPDNYYPITVLLVKVVFFKLTYSDCTINIKFAFTYSWILILFLNWQLRIWIIGVPSRYKKLFLYPSTVTLFINMLSCMYYLINPPQCFNSGSINLKLTFSITIFVAQAKDISLTSSIFKFDISTLLKLTYN